MSSKPQPPRRSLYKRDWQASLATPLGTPRKPQPPRRSLYKRDWQASLATPLGTPRKPQPPRRSLYKRDWQASLATPLGTPRKPQPLRRSRCSLRSSQLAPFGRSLIAVLASQGVPRSGCPFQSRPGVVAGRRERRLGRRRRAPAVRHAVRSGRRARVTRAREAGARRAVRCRRAPAEAGEGRGLRLLCGRCRGAVAAGSRSWRTERAMAGRAEGESLRQALSEPGGAERFRYPAQRPRAAEGFLGVCGAVQRSSVCTCKSSL